MANVQKARYWTAVMYPESMVENWEEEIGDILQVPYAYCIHNQCVDQQGEPRKNHVHIMIAYANTTTYKAVMSVFEKLGTVNKVERVHNVRHMYNYLIHDTETCKKKGKHLYSQKERITGNNFDIGAYEQIGVVDKENIILEIRKLIKSFDFQDFSELDDYMADNFDLVGLNQRFNIPLNLAFIRARIGAINLHKVLRKPPGKVLINHMQPHNRYAFQTNCKPPEVSTTCAWQNLPFAGRAIAFAVWTVSRATRWVRTRHGRHAV